MMGHEQHIDWHGIRIEEYIPEGVIDRCGNHDGEPGQKLRKIEGKNLTKLHFLQEASTMEKIMIQKQTPSRKKWLPD